MQQQTSTSTSTLIRLIGPLLGLVFAAASAPALHASGILASTAAITPGAVAGTPSCSGISFPYTLNGASNLDRVANLRLAIECANANGSGADIIDLNGFNVALPIGDVLFYAGATGLTQITSDVLIRDGTLSHDTSMGGYLFRTFDITASGTLTIQNVIMQGDRAPTPGGAFYNFGTVNVISSTISGYSTGNRGGVLHNASGSTATFSNSLLYDNDAVYAHAIDNNGAVTIINSTFDKHTSTGQFGFVLEGGGYTVRNSILWNPGSGPGQISAGNTVSDSIVKGGYSGGSNILNTSPLFVNEPGNDFRLQTTSPAINVGANSFVPADATDVDGDSNTTENTPDLDLNSRIVASVVDLGAYENQDAVPTTPSVSIAVAPSSVLEDGAGNLTYTVTRSLSLPSATTVNVSAIGTATSGSDYSGAVASVTIPANATTATITINPTADAMVEPGETVVIAIAAGAGYSVGTPSSATGTIANDDSAGVVVTQSGGSTNVTEGGATDSYSLILTSQPSANVVVFINSGTQLTATPSPLTFTSGNWNVAQTVTVTAVDDAIVEGPHTGMITHVVTGGDAIYNVIPVASVTGNITDNDNVGITVNPTAGLITTEAGSTATFTVVLNSQPTANVSIGLGSSDTTEGTVAPNSLVFTSGNWNVSQTVTVSGVDDLIVDGDVGYSIVTAAAVSADAAYSGINPANVGVTNTDDDTAGITVSPTAGLTTTEAGGTDSFTVVLDSQPTANVSIGLGSSDTTEGTVAPTSLVFNNGNWNEPQTVTVTGIDDLIVDGDVGYSIVTAAGVSADSAYSGVNPANVAVTNTDDDTAGITVSPTAGLTTTEAGGTDSFTVVLDSQPTANVSIGLSSSDTTEGTVGPTSLTFTSVNWNLAQTVTVTGVDDAIVDGDVAYSIVTAAATSADPAFDAINPANVSVSNTDDDTAGITVSPTAGLVTTEAGGTATFTLVLDSQPTASVSIGLSSSDLTEGTVSPTSRVFTSGNWNVPQTVTVSGVDDLIVDGDVGYSIGTAAAVSADGAYNGFNAADVAVTNTDDDVAGITVTPTAGLVTTEAGGTATFTLVLNSQPTANVLIGLSSSDLTEGTVGPTSLTFTSVNWNLAQTVTVTGVDDAIVDGDVAYSIVTAAATSADPAFDAINPANVSISNTDDDTAGITVSPTAGLVTTEAGGTATFTVVLNSQPTGNVAIGLTSSDTTEGTVAPATLMFTTANWDDAQTVTVSGVDDPIVDGDVAYSIVTAPATSADGNYSGVNAANVAVSNTDDDTAGITVSPTAGLVTSEVGDIATFVVVLNSQPTGAVSIGLGSSDTSEGTVAPATLTFSTANWDDAQTVTVSGVDDLTVDGDVTYSIVTAPATSADSNYDGVNPADVSVSNTDDDTAGITVNPTTDLVTTEAGDTATFVVVLNSQPTGDVTIGLSSSDTSEGTVAPASLTFTAANWNVAQTVTVTGVDDLIVDGDVTYSIVTAPATSADGNYDGVNPADVSVSNTDDDTAGVTVSPTSGLVTTEAGDTATFSVVLNSQPMADVSIGLSSSDTSEGTVAPATLTFTTANWNVAQTVTITGVDDLIVDGDVAYSIITAPAASSDGNYDGANPVDVSVSNTDDDTAGITVNPTAGLVTSEAGDTATFVVVLNSEPAGDVSIGLSSSDTTEGTVAPETLTFTAANWDDAQTVTVTGVDDLIADGDVTYSIVTAPATSSDGNYDGFDASDASVSNTDDDTAGITVNPTAGLVTTEAGDSATFTVVLNTEPVADVLIGLSSSNTSEGTVAPATLTFTAANWNVAQTATVTGVADGVFDGDVAYSIVTAPADSADPNYDGTDPADVALSNTDSDSPPMLSITSPSQPEGNAGNAAFDFVVSLSEVSALDVTFTHATADGTATVADNDYVALSAAQATIPAGELSITIPVLVNGDAVFEGDESFSLDLTNVSDANPASLTGTATLIDDDQQSTTTAITSSKPDPSVVGQPFTVNASVSGQTQSPLGTITISDGSASCGPVTVTAGTAPASSASCELIGSTAGISTLTATYTPASDAFAPSSNTGTHQVDAAATAISVSGPTQSPINQPTAFSFALSVLAPGGGTPGGVVTLSTSGSSCDVTVPTATPSCELSFDTLGPATVSASFAPGNGDYLASSSSGADDAQTNVFAAVDLQLTKTDADAVAQPGETVLYTLGYRNVGSEEATGVMLTETVPANTRFDQAASSPGWSCADNAPAGTVCMLAVGIVAASAPAVPVTFALRVDSSLPDDVNALSNSASVSDDGSNGEDPTPEDNTAVEQTPVDSRPDLSVLKSTNATGFLPGQPVVYQLDYRNQGSRTATGVSVIETVPDDTVFVAASSTPGWSCADGAVGGTLCAFPVGSVAAGEEGSVAFAVALRAGQVGGVIRNSVSIEDDGSNGTDPTPDNNASSVALSAAGALAAPRVVPATGLLGHLLLMLALMLAGGAAWSRQQRYG